MSSTPKMFPKDTDLIAFRVFNGLHLPSEQPITLKKEEKRAKKRSTLSVYQPFWCPDEVDFSQNP